MDDFDTKFIFFSDEDNNDFVTFVFMVLFGNHRLLYGHSELSRGLRPSGQIPQTKTTTSDFETKPWNKCYTVRSLFSN